jgi:ABC-type sugar transport system permease subunit/ABC-type glycerol-3-phosphate transport system substrate-binding protein
MPFSSIFSRLWVALILAGLSGPVPAGIVLRVWGLETGEHNVGTRAAVREFERRHPAIDVQMAIIPVGTVQGVMDPQKLLCAIAGGRPPDAVYQDRFTIGEWASRGAFMPLDDFLRRSDAPRPEQYYAPCWAECVYQGRVYAIPADTDVRVLYYNAKLLRDAGYVDADSGEVKLPQSWDELRRMAVDLSRRDAQNRYCQVGFIPNFGNAWLYLYSFLNGGSFLSPDGRTCTLSAPANVEALQWMVGTYDALGGFGEVKGFQDEFQARITDPFLIGQVVMKIDVDNFVRDIARYRPDLDFGLAMPPPPAGRESCTWSGGFAYVIPRGADHPEEAWQFISWMTSLEGRLFTARAQARHNRSRGQSFFPRLEALRPASQAILAELSPPEPTLRAASLARLQFIEHTRTRPVTPVGQLLWDQQNDAFYAAVEGTLQPAQALQRAQAVVQARLDKVYRPESALPPVLPWRWPALVFSVLGVGLLGWVVARFRRLPGSPARRRSEVVTGLAFAAPWVVGFGVFTLWPILQSIVLSFCEYDVLHPARWIGLGNYGRAAADPLFGQSLWNTVYMALWVPITLAVGLAIALLLDTDVRGQALWRTLFYLPAVIPTVAVAVLWVWVLNPTTGLLNEFLRPFTNLFHRAPPDWLQSEFWAKPAIVLTILWAAGGSMIIWLAGLAGIPRSYYEAARVDGAGAWQRFRHVTIPMLTPYIFFNLVMGIIAAFQIFNQAFIMTEGGPNHATLFYVLRLFDVAFRYLEMGYASAMAWVLFLIILALTLVNFVLAPRWVHYEGEATR